LDSISIGLSDQDAADLEKQLSPSLIKLVGDKAAAEGEDQARKLVTTPSPIELTPTRRPSTDILAVNDAPPVAEEGNADDAVALARLTRFMERTLPTDEEDVVEDKMDTEVAAANDQVDDKKEDDQKVEEEEPKTIKKVSFSLLRRQSSRKMTEDSADEGRDKEAKPTALRRKWMPKRSSSRKLASEGDESLTEESTVSSYSYNPKKIQRRAKRGSSPKPKSSTTEDTKPTNDDDAEEEDELFQDPTRDHMVSFSDLSEPETTPSYRSAQSQRLSSSERGGRRLSISERNEQNHRNARMARASSDVTQDRKGKASNTQESFSKSDNYLIASAYYPGQDDHATSAADRDAKEEALMADAIAQSLPEAVPVSDDTGYAEEEKCDEDGIAVDQSQTRVVSRRRKSNRLLKSSGSRVKKFGLSFLDMTSKSKKKGPIDVDTCEPASTEVMNASVVESSRSLMATSDGFDSRGTQRAFLGDSIDDHYDRRRQFATSHSPPQQEQSSRPSPHHHDSYGSYRSNRSSSNSSQQNNHRRGSHRNSGSGSISSRQWDEYSRRRDGYDDHRGGSSSRRRYDDDRRRRHYDRGRGYDGRGDNSVVSEIYVDQYASSGYRDHRQQQRHSYQLSDAGSVTSSSMYSSYGGGGGYRSHYHDPRRHSSFNPHYHRGAYDPYYRGSGGGSSEVSWDDLGDPIQAALESSIRDLSSQVVGNQLVAKKRVLKPEEPVLSNVDIGPWQCRNCGFANANGRHLQCAVCSTNR